MTDAVVNVVDGRAVVDIPDAGFSAAVIAGITEAGAAQIALIEDEGTEQTGLVTTEGGAQVALVTAEGDTQVARVGSTPGAAMYVDKAAGDAAGLATGLYFIVPLAPGSGFALYRVTGAGTSTLVNTYPDMQSLNGAITTAQVNARLTPIGKSTLIYDTIGVPSTPVTSAASVANSFYILNKKTRDYGRVPTIKTYGNNSGGVVTIRRFTLSGSTFTQVGSDVTVTIAAGLNTYSENTHYTPIEFGPNEYLGFQAYSSTGKIALLAGTAIPNTHYWVQSAGFTGGAAGTFTSTGSAQIQFNLEYSGSLIEATTDALRSSIGDYIYIGRDTAVVQAGSTATSSTTIPIITKPTNEVTVLEELSLGVAGAGWIHVFAFAPAGGDKATETRRFWLYCSGAGANTFVPGDTSGTSIPRDLELEAGSVLGVLSYTTGGGAGITYTTSSSTVDVQGLDLSVTVTELASATTVTLTQLTSSRRYEVRAKLRVLGSGRKLSHVQNGVLMDENFSSGQRPASINTAGTWTFGTGTVTSGSTGLANCLEGVFGQAVHRTTGRIVFQFGSDTSVIWAYVRDVTGNYSSMAVIDAANNKWDERNAWIGGNTEEADVYDTKNAPFTAALVSGRDYAIDRIRVNRGFTYRLTDLVTLESSAITKDFNTWVSSADLDSVGLEHGRLGIAAKSGSVIVKSMWQSMDYDEPTILLITTSMSHSRVNWSDSLANLVDQAAPGGAVCIHLDGVNGNSFPLMVKHVLRFLPSIKHVVAYFGENDDSSTQATFEARMPEGVRYCLDRGVTMTMIAPPLNYTDAEFYTGMTTFLTGLTSIGVRHVVNLKVGLSVNGAGAVRDDSFFAGLTDVHFGVTGHRRCFDLLRRGAPYLRLSQSV